MQDTSPNDSILAVSRPQRPAGEQAGATVPVDVWQLCGVPASLQSTDLAPAAEALRQLDSIHCPMDVVACLQEADEAIAQAVGHIRCVQIQPAALLLAAQCGFYCLVVIALTACDWNTRPWTLG